MYSGKLVRLNTRVCKVCKKGFKSEKALKDHIFNNYVGDRKHIILKKEIRKKRFEGAKLRCPICKKIFFKNIGSHLKFNKDYKHNNFLKEQRRFFVEKFKKGYSYSDIIKIKNKFTDMFCKKYVTKKIIEVIGKEEFLRLSKLHFSRKRKEYWQLFNVATRKKIMQRVRDAEWKMLTKTERRNHPWVIAGRKASLASAKRGSKNQEYAFKLLKENMPAFNWKYNYVIDNDWHVDIAEPEKSVYIEWDGRHHFIPIHGRNYLNNRRNRDKVKNKIIQNDLNGLLIRIKDLGRFNPEFVESKIKNVCRIIRKRIKKGELMNV